MFVKGLSVCVDRLLHGRGERRKVEPAEVQVVRIDAEQGADRLPIVDWLRWRGRCLRQGCRGRRGEGQSGTDEEAPSIHAQASDSRCSTALTAARLRSISGYQGVLSSTRMPGMPDSRSHTFMLPLAE